MWTGTGTGTGTRTADCACTLGKRVRSWRVEGRENGQYGIPRERVEWYGRLVGRDPVCGDVLGKGLESLLEADFEFRCLHGYVFVCSSPCHVMPGR